MGTLASQAEIGVTGPSTGQAASVGGSGVSPAEKF